MSGLEVNKIIASIVIAIIAIGLISILADLLINNEEEVVKNAYYIDLSEAESTSASSKNNQITITDSISPLLVSASLEKGEKIFKKCGACHTYKKDDVNKVGPNLWNILNNPKASIQGFNYSKELAEYGGIWDFEELNQFLYKPKDYIKGTKMNFSGLKKVQDRADLILFLREQSDNPVPLP